MSRTTQSSYAGRKIVYGSIAGIIAGIVMLVIMTALITTLKLPPNLFPMLLGTMIVQTGSNVLIAGMGLHFIASIAIGAIFGTVTSRMAKFMTDRFLKGITFGVITGIIAFVLLFIPVSIILLPQHMMNFINMMNPGMSTEVIMLIILTSSLLSHLSYGITLGITMTTIERTFAKRGYKG